MRRLRTLGATLLAISLPATAGAVAPDEDDGLSLDPIPRDQLGGGISFPEGDYVGSMGLSGRFTLSAGGATVSWSGEAAGPVDFSVVNGVANGTWSMNGIASVGATAPVINGAASTWSVEGTLSGVGPGPYSMSSSGGSGESTAVVIVPQIGERRLTESFSIPPATGELERVLAICGQIQADWDQQIQAGLSQLPGTSGSIRTYLTALPTGESEVRERIDALLERVAELSRSIGDVDQVIAQIFVIVAQAEELLDIVEGSEFLCDADGMFMRIVTMQLQDIIHTLLRSWDSLSESTLDSVFLLRRLLAAGLQAGAIGSGAVDPAAAAVLELLAADVAQRAFDEALAADTVNQDRFVDLAVIGTMLDITYAGPNGNPVEPGDVCLALGGCS